MPLSGLPKDNEPDERKSPMKWPEILIVTGLTILGLLFMIAICSGQVRQYKDHRAKRRYEKKSWPKPSRAEQAMMDSRRQHQNGSEEELVGYCKR